MKICIVGKYPPIEGGVSTQTYWLARGLARRGNQVHVVTNADEVEPFYRLTMQDADSVWYEATFDNGGSVRVYNADPRSAVGMGHIPQSNPFVSKLAALATDIIRSQHCAVILAYYFEPYGVAGWLASRWTGRPLLIKHAGSDLDRLFRVPDLATTYREILRSADGVVTQRGLMPRFIGLGVPADRLLPDAAYGLAAEAFHPLCEPLDLAALALNACAPVGSTPVIGAYGKIGVTKGSFDLIAALGRIAAQGIDFRFAAMIGQAQYDSILPALIRAGIVERTIGLPMLPNWRVPGFLRACTAVCFLERDFPVAIHGPIIPREAFACGTCLILSGEIAAKQRYRDRLVTGENVIIVPDPKDRNGLADALQTVLRNPARAAAIGAQAATLSRTLEDHEAFIQAWDGLLHATVSRAAGAISQQAPVAARLGDVAGLMPALFGVLERICPAIVARSWTPEMPPDLVDAAIAFCDAVGADLDGALTAPLVPRVSTALAYTKARLAVSRVQTDPPPVFAVSDRRLGRPATPAVLGPLRPVIGLSVTVEAFDFDVAEMAMMLGAPTEADVVADLAALLPRPTLVLFHRAANLSPCELRIDEATHALVSRCTGRLTTDGLIDTVCDLAGARSTEQRDDVAARVCQALDRLYQAGILVFGDFRPGWGWQGGLRGQDPMIETDTEKLPPGTG